MAQACQLARAKLARYVSSLKESTSAEKTGTLVKAGYLASFKTTARNVLGNASFGGVEYLATKPLAVGIDYLGAVLKSASTFGKVKPHEYRQIANTLSAKGLARGAMGIREGVAKAVTLLKTGVDAERVNQKFDLNEVTFKNNALDKSVHAVFNVLEAQDKPFFGFAFQTSLYGRARLMGIREGLTGKRLGARTNELLASPSEEMILGATADAQYATFKNETWLGKRAANLRQGARMDALTATPGKRIASGAGLVFLDLTIPFTRVASAIANAGIDYSPAGFGKAVVQAMDKDPKIQAQMAQQLSRATIGSALTLAGYAMYGNGTITGSTPTSPSEKKLWDAEGKQANSILLGGKWRSITFLGPLAIPMLMGANIRKFTAEGERTPGEIAGAAAGSIGKTMTEQSYLQGLDNIVEAINDPTGKGASSVAGMVPIPAIVGQAATAVDPVLRQATGVTEKIQARIPFASKSLPPRIDPFGNRVMKTEGGATGAIRSFIDIANSRADRSTPVTKEMDRLGLGLSSIGAQGTIDKKKFIRTPEQLRQLTMEAGPILKDSLTNVVARADYQEADDDARREMLEKMMRLVLDAARKKDKERRRGQ